MCIDEEGDLPCCIVAWNDNLGCVDEMAKALGGDIAQVTTQPPHEEDLPPGGL